MRKNRFIALAPLTFVVLFGVSQAFAQSAIDELDAENGAAFGGISKRNASDDGTLRRLIDKFDAESAVPSNDDGSSFGRFGSENVANGDAFAGNLTDETDLDVDKPVKTKRTTKKKRTRLPKKATVAEEDDGAVFGAFQVPFPDWRYAPRDLARIRAPQMPPELPGWGPFGNEYEFPSYEWTARRYRMGYGDVVIAVNDRRVHNYLEYRKALSRTGAYAVLTLCDPQYNAIYCVGVKKNQGRFGVTLRDWYGRGVAVVGCEPWFLCRVYKPSYPIRLSY